MAPGRPVQLIGAEDQITGILTEEEGELVVMTPLDAQRIVAELKDKAPALSVAGMHLPSGSAPGRTPAEGNIAAEAISALSNLGYQPAQASAAIAAAMQELGDEADTAKLIRRGLKELAR